MNEEKKRPVFINRSVSDSSFVTGCLRRRHYNHYYRASDNHNHRADDNHYYRASDNHHTDNDNSDNDNDKWSRADISKISPHAAVGHRLLHGVPYRPFDTSPSCGP